MALIINKRSASLAILVFFILVLLFPSFLQARKLIIDNGKEEKDKLPLLYHEVPFKGGSHMEVSSMKFQASRWLGESVPSPGVGNKIPH